MTREELENVIIGFMDTFTTMTLACCSHGKPWAAAVYYARQDFDLIFFSSSKSLHARLFSENPAAAAEIHGQHERWQDIKGLQMEGEVRQITGAMPLARATATYLLRYSFVREFFSDPAALSLGIAEKMAGVALYIFRPQAIRYMDNQGGFGNRWKLEISEGRSVGEPVRG
jgi:uncharacterized protein